MMVVLARTPLWQIFDASAALLVGRRSLRIFSLRAPCRRAKSLALHPTPIYERGSDLEERAEVAACLHLWVDDEWDEKMKRDLAAGKLDKILDRVDADIAENKIRKMP